MGRRLLALTFDAPGAERADRPPGHRLSAPSALTWPDRAADGEVGAAVVHALSPTQFSAVFAVNAVGLVVAGQASSPLIARLGPGPVLGAGLVTGFVGGAALLAVVLAGIGLIGILPALFLVVACIGIVFPSGTALALQGSPSTAGAAAGLLGLAQFAVGAISASLVGVAGRGTALPVTVVIAACELAALTAFWLLVARPRTQPSPAGTASGPAPHRQLMPIPVQRGGAAGEAGNSDHSPGTRTPHPCRSLSVAAEGVPIGRNTS